MTESSAIDGSEHLYAIQLSDDRRLTPEQLADYIAESYVYDKENTDTTTVAGKINALEAALMSATNLLPRVYPVGSIYWSSRNTSPASLFGGTWTQIQNRFLIGAGGSYVVNSTGGEATHTLTAAEMPSHNHGGTTGGPSTNVSGGASPATTGGNSRNHTHSTPKMTATTTSNGSHHHSFPRSYAYDNSKPYVYYTRNGAVAQWMSMTTNGEHSHTVSTTATTSGASSQTHTHTLQSHTHDMSNHTHSITAAGSGGAHNNMPPYVVYYCWERTA